MEVLVNLAANIDVFLLVLARTLGLFLIAPVFSARTIPPQLKVGLSAIVAYMVVVLMRFPNFKGPDSFWVFALQIATETMVGLMIGFVAYLLFAAIQTAGQAIDMQMGFAIVSVVDPMYGTQVPIMGNFKYLLALITYLVTDSHHMLFAAIYQSFAYIPLAGFSYHAAVSDFIFGVFSGVMVTAIKVALPVVGALFIVDVALGIVARTVPQMNIFVVGMPLKILVGFALLILIIPLYLVMLSSLFSGNFADITRLLKVM